MKQSDRFNDNFNKQTIDAFDSFELNESDLDLIKEFASTVLQNIPQKSFNCAQISAALGAVIVDNSEIPTIVVSGHLDYHYTRLFKCLKPIPFDSNKDTNEIWEGHCWVEIPNLIIDLSIFRTIYYGNVNPNIKTNIINNFGHDKGALIAPIIKMKELGFHYTPCYEIDEKRINGLLYSLK